MMSDTSTDTTDPIDDPNAPNIKALRDAAEQGKADRAENEKLRKELLFTKAGIDTDTKLGALLFKTHDGDDVEALKTEWSELAPAPAAEAPPADPGDQPGQAEQQRHREDISGTGAPAGGQGEQTENPYDAAYAKFNDRSSGLPLSNRQEDALAVVLEGFVAGDPRVMFDRTDWAQKQQTHGDD
jgi:hypothetical protein